MGSFKWTGAVLGLVVAGVCASTATADTIFLTPAGTLGRGVSTHYSGTRGTVADYNGSAVRFAWTVGTIVDNGDDPDQAGLFSTGQTIYTFCTELTQFQHATTFDFSDPGDLPTDGFAGPMGSFRAGLISELMANHWSESISGDRDKAAGMQIAMWEIVYEDGIDDASDLGSLDVLAGTFTASSTGAANTYANDWLDELIGGLGVLGGLIAFGSDSYQDQMTWIPLPAPIFLAAFGLAGVAAVRRKMFGPGAPAVV